MAKNTIFVWYDKDAEAAARFYAETFPNSCVYRKLDSAILVVKATKNWV
jgi:predicted 3-demethylubiquinone-9 3-methyltransferase (glyoxalase superfamily)